MSYPSYPELKDSGVEWLGEIPKHWTTKRFKFSADFYGGGTPSKDNQEYWAGDIPWVSPKDMKRRVIQDAEDHISEAALSDSATRLIDKGAVLLVVRSGILKHSIPVAINAVPVTLNQDMKAIVLKPWLTSDYVAYVIDGCQESLLLEWRKAGATVESLEHEYITNSQWLVPPLEEQQAIAAFLDCKTAELDELIRLKERQIELLGAKRQALICHAVTRGLDPSVKLRPSGIEWLGEIPANWNLTRIKYESKVISKGTTPSTIDKAMVDDGIRFIKAENISDGAVEPKPEFFIDDETDDLLSRSRLEGNDLLIVIAGATTGKVGVISPQMLPANVNQAVCFVRLNNPDLAEFFKYWLATDRMQKLIWQFAVQAAQPNLSMENLGNIPIAVPPREEIFKLINWIKEQEKALNTMAVTLQSQVDKLREYRQALISAAVTGKIDVRGVSV